MKKILLIIFLVGIQAIGFSQNKKVITFKVEGVCGMCKERIEYALDVKGVIYSKWDKQTKMIEVAYKTKKITEEEIHQLLADAGHSTDKVKANRDAYNNLDACCKYEELETH